MNCLQINDNWTLFLDRDGVINHRIMGDYIKRTDEFVLLDRVAQTIANLSKLFKYTFVVTNQQGIGKGLMTVEDLNAIHNVLKQEVEKEGGMITKLYYCPDLANTGSKCRKPEIGMALQARKEFEGIDLKRSIMVGDTKNDMLFGRRAGMRCVLVSSNIQERRELADFYDFAIDKLAQLPEILVYEKQ